MTTHQDTVIAAGFVGNLTGNVTGNVTGDITGQSILPASVAYASDGAIALTEKWALLTKGSVGAYTLAAPGAGNVGKRMIITAGSAFAHVVTVTGLVGGTTVTFTNAIGHSCELLAVSATVWALLADKGITQT